MIPNSGFREGLWSGGCHDTPLKQSEKDFGVDFMVDEGQRGTFF